MIAFLAIGLGGILTQLHEYGTQYWLIHSALDPVVTSAPFWIPFLFAAYIFGRQELSGLVLAVFLIAEAVSIGAMYYWLARLHL